MKKLICSGRLIHFGVCGLMGLAIVIGSAGLGRAADDSEEEPALDTKIFRNILKGLGMRHEESHIDYRERSPLVVPINKDLPKPDTEAITERNPQWPKDPDILRAKKVKAEKKYSNPNPEDVRPELPSQLEANAPRRTVSDGRASVPNGVGDPVSPAELHAKGLFSGGYFAQKEDYAPFTVEPERNALTEPPPGYRTPSPTQPYGVGKEKWSEKSIPDRNIPVR